MLLKIGNIDFSDFVADLKVDKNYLTSDFSGRNAAGTMVIDVVASKYKISVTFRTMTVSEAQSLLSALSGYANLSITFMNPFTNATTTITSYIATPSVTYYRYSADLKLTKPFTIDFIEM